MPVTRPCSCSSKRGSLTVTSISFAGRTRRRLWRTGSSQGSLRWGVSIASRSSRACIDSRACGRRFPGSWPRRRPPAARGPEEGGTMPGWKLLLTDLVIDFNYFVLFYFLVLNSIYFLLFLVSLREIWYFVRRTFFSDYQQLMQSEMTWPISVLVPAHNEEKTIVQTVRSLQMVNFGEFEIVVVNDGSTDGTLERVVEAFEMRRIDHVYRRSIPTAPVRGTYASLEHPNLLVVDKEKGGKS